MANILVHNISDRPNTSRPPRAYKVANQTIRPGKFISVDSSLIGQKEKELHGLVLWFGELPARFLRTSSSALQEKARFEEVTKPESMTLGECREYLAKFSLEELEELCAAVVPPLAFAVKVPASTIIPRLSRVLFAGNRDIDPEKFFWLRRWSKEGEFFLERS